MTAASILAIAVGAMIALSRPVQIDSVDHLGQPILCGTTLRPDSAGPSAADQLNRDRHRSNPERFIVTDYTDQCAGIIGAKRRHAMLVTVTAAGMVLTIAGFAVVVRHARRRRNAEPPR